MPTTMWIHGNVVKVEASEVRSVETISRGWGTHFLLRDSEATYWFHFPLPTLSTFSDTQLKLSKVYVFFGTDGTVIRAVHIYDGPVRLMMFEGLNITGNHSVEIDNQNCWPIDPAVNISRGLGISVGVQIMQGEQFALPEILFTTAGAELTNP
jgi:hypothetical protein